MSIRRAKKILKKRDRASFWRPFFDDELQLYLKLPPGMNNSVGRELFHKLSYNNDNGMYEYWVEF